VRREYNVVALVKGAERYVFVYDDDSRDALVDALRDHAADPRLNFNWFDAAVLTQKAKEQALQNDKEKESEPKSASRPRL
jgi:hypothetical protein